MSDSQFLELKDFICFFANLIMASVFVASDKFFIGLLFLVLALPVAPWWRRKDELL